MEKLIEAIWARCMEIAKEELLMMFDCNLYQKKVNNYAMREVTKAETEELNEAIRARSLEMAEEKLAAEYIVREKSENDDASSEDDAASSLLGGGGEMTNANALTPMLDGVGTIGGGGGSDTDGGGASAVIGDSVSAAGGNDDGGAGGGGFRSVNESGNGGGGSSIGEPEAPQASTVGSRGVDFGGGSEYFYSQFELTTRSRKIIQMVGARRLSRLARLLCYTPLWLLIIHLVPLWLFFSIFILLPFWAAARRG